jgi:predicted dehydrogenase
MAESPKSILCRVNAKKIPPDHWGHDPDIGGGRIVGEVCHFIDLAMFIAGAHIVSVAANEMLDADCLMDTLTVTLSFENGSVATIAYFSNGNEKVPKEYVEVFCNGETAIIDDFKSMTFYGKNPFKMKLKKQDKGHTEELKRFIRAIEKGQGSPISFSEIYNSSLATIKTIEAVKQNRLIQL